MLIFLHIPILRVVIPNHKSGYPVVEITLKYAVCTTYFQVDVKRCKATTKCSANTATGAGAITAVLPSDLAGIEGRLVAGKTGVEMRYKKA